MINYIKQGWLVLLLALLFGSALAMVQKQLGPVITKNKQLARENAAMQVVANAAKVEQVTVELDGASVDVFRVLDDSGNCAGWAAPASTMGYADKIELIVGLSADAARVSDFKTIYSQETPGLGDKIKTAEFHRSFTDNLGGKTGRPADVRLIAAKGKELTAIADGEIVAITGATISSQAVCDAIYESLVKTGLTAKLAAGEFKAAASE